MREIDMKSFQKLIIYSSKISSWLLSMYGCTSHICIFQSQDSCVSKAKSCKFWKVEYKGLPVSYYEKKRYT